MEELNIIKGETNFFAIGKWVNNMIMTEIEVEKIVESANFIDAKVYRRKIEDDTKRMKYIVLDG